MNTVIFMEGGIIQEILTDKKSNILIVDRDVDDVEESDKKRILGSDAYVYEGLQEGSINPGVVKKVFQEADRQL